MRALRFDASIDMRENAQAPYPSWSRISDRVAPGNDLRQQDSQTFKETQIWQALAEEDSAVEGAEGPL